MRKVENTIDINVKPEKIFTAFLDPKMLRDWWGVEKTLIEAREGGNYALAWGVSENGFGYVTTGRIETFQLNKALKISNFLYFNPKKEILGPTCLSIDVMTGDKASVLTVCQSGYLNGESWDWYYKVVNESWPGVLMYLKTYLEKITRK